MADDISHDEPQAVHRAPPVICEHCHGKDQKDGEELTERGHDWWLCEKCQNDFDAYEA